jgi:hypothetical protein
VLAPLATNAAFDDETSPKRNIEIKVFDMKVLELRC